MQNILFLHSTLETGGAEMMRLRLLCNIDRNKYRIKICCIGRKGRIGCELERMGYQVDELGQNPDSLSLNVTYKIAKYLKREKPDILHCCLFNANFHGRIASLICRVTGIIIEEHGEHKFYNGMKFLPHICANFILSRFTNYIVCCSGKFKTEIIKKERLPREKVVCIENCLDAIKYRIKILKEDIKIRYGISDEITLIIVASLKIGKGHDYMIEALHDIKHMGYRFKIFFAGDGPLAQVFHNKCAELDLLNNAIFLGNIDNVPDYLNASDIFILPSFSEGLSIALMEAMLMGLTAIVTDVGANADLIKTGFNGTIISPGDREGLKNSIIFYLENRDLIKKFGERSRAIIATRYSSIGKYTNKYYELWDKCAHGAN